MISSEEFRKGFPVFNEKIQLASCSQSAMHTSVKQSVDEYMNIWEHEGMDWVKWVETSEQARILFAKQINAEPDEISIVSSVSHAISAISTSIEVVGGRNKVMITDFDFPTVGHVWGSAREDIQVDFISQNESGINSIEEYKSQLPTDLLLFGTSHVNFYNGYKQDLKAVSEVVHEKGGYIFVDAYQSFGQSPIDVKEMDIDFLATGMQKYGFGIPGIAFLYIKKEIADQMTPRVTGWFGQQNPFAFDIRGKDYASAAKRFDSGTFPMINGYAALAALKLIDKLDVKEVEKYLQSLSSFTSEKLAANGLDNRSQFAFENKGSNTAIYVGNGAAAENELRKRNIIAASRKDVIRIAPHYYNTEEDIEIAVNELKKVLDSSPVLF